jgi:hypothetical protein
VGHFFENVTVAPWTSCAYCGHTIKLGNGAMCKCMQNGVCFMRQILEGGHILIIISMFYEDP